MGSGDDGTRRKEGPNQHRILEFARSAAVQHAANLLEHVADAKRIRKRFEATFGDDRVRSPGDAYDQGSDMLFDMLRLSAQYLNEAAKLGHRYKDVAERGLENMYARMAPKTRAPAAEELVFDARRTTHKFAVENDVNPAAEAVKLSFRGVLDSRLSRYKSPFTIRVGSRPVKVPSGDKEHPILEGKIRIPFAKATLVELEVDLSKFAGRQSSMDLTIEIPLADEQVVRRRVPIRVDGRKYQPPSKPAAKAKAKAPRGTPNRKKANR